MLLSCGCVAVWLIEPLSVALGSAEDGSRSLRGEVVRLKKEINLVKTPKINDWLALLESGMKATLAELLAEAIEEFTPIFASESIDPAALNATRLWFENFEASGEMVPALADRDRDTAAEVVCRGA
ncbi:hypothetical protein B0T24DRAFT_708608 [Lasiosphaeria ovina]|uniref:Uncharacterized protein n=1 Tax=Lasiosphaeria ovina TaxID=92902 RepID=A0AAE0K502_9PEZI|nr:hypothetical protein B0T24DRAFT_708608 [Lasiosphaeria ovina]